MRCRLDVIWYGFGKKLLSAPGLSSATAVIALLISLAMPLAPALLAQGYVPLPPPAPMITSSTAGNGQATLTWSAPALYAGPGFAATWFTVHYGSSGTPFGSYQMMPVSATFTINPNDPYQGAFSGTVTIPKLTNGTA